MEKVDIDSLELLTGLRFRAKTTDIGVLGVGQSLKYSFEVMKTLDGYFLSVIDFTGQYVRKEGHYKSIYGVCGEVHQLI